MHHAYSMDYELRVRFFNTNTYDMVDALKALFVQEVGIRVVCAWTNFFQLGWKRMPA
jgi:hypothetical protein